jgi:hypothetical protein
VAAVGMDLLAMPGRRKNTAGPVPRPGDAGRDAHRRTTFSSAIGRSSGHGCLRSQHPTRDTSRAMPSDLRVCLCVSLARASGLVDAAFLRVPAAHRMEQDHCRSDEVGTNDKSRLVPAGQAPDSVGRVLTNPGRGGSLLSCSSVAS